VFVHLGRLRQFSEVPDLSALGSIDPRQGATLDISDAALTAAKAMSDLQPQALLLLQAAYTAHRKALKRQHHLPRALHQ
jgi:hypothetical protein